MEIDKYQRKSMENSVCTSVSPSVRNQNEWENLMKIDKYERKSMEISVCTSISPSVSNQNG